MDLKDVIKKPLVSEKSLNRTAFSEYTFWVEPRAKKEEIKKAVEDFFDVKVLGVKTVNLSGKKRRVGKKRLSITTPDRKKAIVKLAPEQKIEYFETGGKSA
ncbi:50S ribosomal protein L23 [Candidatus Shapirobacteria bacterium]|nr:50S ribosomal protein L23 [Candidatus Shapirobacteria bacterium]